MGYTVNHNNPYDSPSPYGRETEEQEVHRFHPHLNPLLSRERDFIRDYAKEYLNVASVG